MFSTPYDANRTFYETEGVPEMFVADTRLFQAEAAILSLLRDEIKDQPILDIGVGAGRTTPHLRSISKDYVGIDYSEKMINLCGQRIPGASFFVCDARDLSRFGDERFAAVFFSWNGIDSVSPTDRVRVLGEVNRVLKKTGVFVFSAHNLDWWLHRRLSPLNKLCFSASPRELMSRNKGPLKVYAAGLLGRIRHRLANTDSAVVLEYEEFVVLPIIYTRREAQVLQLAAAGFFQVETVGADGLPFDEESRCRDYLLHYVARKDAKLKQAEMKV